MNFFLKLSQKYTFLLFDFKLGVALQDYQLKL